MIISHLIGGLGNQMFQYAFARSVSIDRNAELKLDTSSFDHYNHHQGFELKSIFEIKAEIATSADIKKILGWRSDKNIRGLISKNLFSTLRGSRFIVEPSFVYSPTILRSIRANCYLRGYWQSEKYFTKASDILRGDFTFKKPLSLLNSELATRIASSNSVSIHIRRGDYIADQKAALVHGTCSIEYYMSAVNYIRDFVIDPEFFVFSDDLVWARENLGAKINAIFVDNNVGEESYNDMRLMSMCKHNILANSTFSWWAGWLNQYPEKIVVAPKRSFISGKNDTDLVPEGWTRI